VFRVQDWKEVTDIGAIMQLLPKLRAALELEKDITNLEGRAKELREEIQRLEDQKASLIQTPAPITGITIPVAQPGTTIQVSSQ